MLGVLARTIHRLVACISESAPGRSQEHHSRQGGKAYRETRLV